MKQVAAIMAMSALFQLPHPTVNQVAGSAGGAVTATSLHQGLMSVGHKPANHLTAVFCMRLLNL
jgi:hypothetical protein